MNRRSFLSNLVGAVAGVVAWPFVTLRSKCFGSTNPQRTRTACKRFIWIDQGFGDDQMVWCVVRYEGDTIVAIEDMVPIRKGHA